MKQSIKQRRLVPLIARASARTKGVTVSCLAAMCCVLGLAGSAFDYTVANAAAASEGAMGGGIDLLAANGFLGSVVLGAVGVVVAAALMLALSLWTAPPALVRFVPPQRHLLDAAD